MDTSTMTPAEKVSKGFVLLRAVVRENMEATPAKATVFQLLTIAQGTALAEFGIGPEESANGE